MQFPLLFGWRFSAVLNKAPYSRCLNPHIGIYRPQRGFVGLTFPPSWPIWNVELDALKRQFLRKVRGEALELEWRSRGCRKVFDAAVPVWINRGGYHTSILGLSVYDMATKSGVVRCWYWSVFGRTYAIRSAGRGVSDEQSNE